MPHVSKTDDATTQEISNSKPKHSTQAGPIHRLPPELLSKIFLMRVYFMDDILPILSVCGAWRHIALRTPHLFTQLYYRSTGSKSHSDPNVLILMFLRFSMKFPVDVRLHFGREKSRTREKTLNSACFHALRKNLPRCRTLHLSSLGKYDLNHLLPERNETCLPILRDIFIETLAEDYSRTRLGTWAAPNLEKLALECRRIEDPCAEVSPLHFIHMDPVKLKSLSLSCPNWKVEHFTEVLARFSNLETCIVHGPFHNFSEAEALLCVELVHLTVLQITCSDAHAWRDAFGLLDPFLQALHVPRLEHLSLSGDWAGLASEGCQQGFASLFSPSSRTLSLKHLTLRNIDIPATTLFSVLERAPLLEHLSFEGTELIHEKEIFAGLTPSSASTWKWPKLSFIRLARFPGRERELIKMFKAHISTYEPRGSDEAIGTGLQTLDIAKSFSTNWSEQNYHVPKEIIELKCRQNFIKIII